MKVWVKILEGHPVRQIKAATVYAIPLMQIYDVLHDAKYRATWDEYMLEAKDFYRLDDHNDVGYYHMRWPAPLTNRDFVNQRSWYLAPDQSEFIIMNFSVALKEMPPRKGVIRAISYLTGYHAAALPGGGVRFTYVTQADVKGKLPKWLINVATTSGAPSLLAKIFKATTNYPAWKKKHEPDFRPWFNPAQSKVPLLAPADYDKVQDDVAALAAAPQEAEPDASEDNVQAELEFAAKLSLDEGADAKEPKEGSQ